MDKQEITTDSVLDALHEVIDPELEKDLVTLNMVRNIKIAHGAVAFDLVLTTPACPLKNEITSASKEAVLAIPGVKDVKIEVRSDVPVSKGLPEKISIPNVRNTIAVASGKGGVGKSTVSVNLALALAKSGAKAGILDIDIYGPSLPLMMGTKGPLETTPEERLIPLKNHGIEMISIGFMIDEETPVIWRGPMVMQLVKQFLTGVEWGELDYLIIDLPPGTGDAQLTLVQTIPLTGVVIVTTPQDVALVDARRAIKMFHEVKVPVIGIIENMSFFRCPHCGGKTDIFNHGGGHKTGERYSIELLGELPIDPEIREGGDAGRPIVVSTPDSPQAMVFTKIAEKVAAKISILDLKEDQ